MVTPVDSLFAVGITVGGLLCWTGILTYRRWEGLGSTAFSAFLVTLGVGTLLGGVFGILGVEFTADSDVRLWSLLPLVSWLFGSVPWLIFTLQYTGRYTEFRPRTVVALSILPLGTAVQILLNIFDIGSIAVLSVIGSVVFIYCAVLMTVGAYLVVETSYTYGHLSVWQGLSLSLIPLGTFVFWNITGLNELDAVVVAGFYVAGGAVALGSVAFTLVRYDLFDSTPAVGTIGERVVASETDDLVFVVDDRDRVIKLNQTALETLGVASADALGVQMSEVLGQGTEAIRPLETLTLETAEGVRRYDPEVSAVTDQHENTLGFILSLRDVTERELREQRLAVLNRVLRHNLRNKVEVVKSHAEVLAEGEDDPHAETILATADEIADLGASARSIDQFVSASTSTTAVDVTAALQEALAEVLPDETPVSVSISAPETATVRTNRAALRAALQEAVENAVAYAETSVEITVEPRADGYEVRVADDGPGIPSDELASLEAGTETALKHGSGLGLWQLQWAVRTIDGDLSFETTDGTTVSVVVPDAEEEEAATPSPGGDTQESPEQAVDDSAEKTDEPAAAQRMPIDGATSENAE